MLKHRINRSVLLILLFAAAVSLMPARAYAAYTPYYVPASKSCVRKKYKGTVVIFAGDSRTMHMADGWVPSSLRKNCAFVWENGGTVTCIGEKGNLKPYLNRMIRKYRKRCIVVLNFGVNGNKNPAKNSKRLVRIYREWMKKYPDVPFFVESVNPTAYTGGSYRNQGVIRTNRYLEEQFGKQYLDIYSYLVNHKIVNPGTGKGTRDNLHYELSVYKKILKKVKRIVLK